MFGAVLASLRAVTTRMVVFDTVVVDLTDDLQNPVELLFEFNLVAAQISTGRLPIVRILSASRAKQFLF